MAFLKFVLMIYIFYEDTTPTCVISVLKTYNLAKTELAQDNCSPSIFTVESSKFHLKALSVS